MRLPIYFDYAATTPVDARVAEKMLGCLTFDGNFANPASRSHVYGWRAEEAVENARRQVADLIHADPREIVWTSGATESNNLAIKGAAQVYRAEHAEGGHIVTSAIEHKAVLDVCAYLETLGFAVTYLRPDTSGIIAPAQVEAALRPDTFLVSVMHANNEIGVINDVAAIGALCRARGILLHVDAAQSVGKIPVELDVLPIDLLSLSAHKLYGPKGIGALFVRRRPRARIEAQMHGGGHERGLRSGTLPTHQIVGLGEACRIAREEMPAEAARILELRQRFWNGISDLEGVAINGDAQHRLPGNLNIGFAGVDGEALLLALKDLAVSTGSACTSASLEPSYVLTALGQNPALAHSALRFSFGRFTTAEEIDFAVELIRRTLVHLRAA